MDVAVALARAHAHLRRAVAVGEGPGVLEVAIMRSDQARLLGLFDVDILGADRDGDREEIRLERSKERAAGAPSRTHGPRTAAQARGTAMTLRYHCRTNAAPTCGGAGAP